MSVRYDTGRVIFARYIALWAKCVNLHVNAFDIIRNLFSCKLRPLTTLRDHVAFHHHRHCDEVSHSPRWAKQRIKSRVERPGHLLERAVKSKIKSNASHHRSQVSKFLFSAYTWHSSHSSFWNAVTNENVTCPVYEHFTSNKPTLLI